MADYHPLIARAVEGLGASSGEARRALYERARAALVSQLRGIDPPLSEADITRERLALEDAIRKVEAETVRRSRTEPRPAAPPFRSSPPPSRPQAPPPPPPPAPVQAAPPRRERAVTGPSPNPSSSGPSSAPLPGPFADVAPPPRPDFPRSEPPPLRVPGDLLSDEAASPAAQPSARSRLLNARAAPPPRDGLKGLRSVVNEVEDLGAASAQAAKTARDTRDFYGKPSPQRYADDNDVPPVRGRVEPHFANDDSDVIEDAPQMRSLEPSYEMVEDDTAFPAPGARGYARDHDDHYEEPRPPRSYRGYAQLAVVLIILAGLVATVSWQWSNITHLYQFFSHLRSRQTQSAQAPTAEPKFPGRVPQDQGAGTSSGTAPSSQAGPAVAQRVVLYQEDPNNPQGKQFVGSAVWRTETVSPGTGLAPELEVRADIEIPEQHMTITWTLRRNTDQALPASHTIEIMFNLPPDFPGGGIANVPGVLMKESEQARGTPLAGLAVKVTNGFFLIGLSAVDADLQRNIQLLKSRPWFDIPIVYNNGGRAILALEKGPPGDRAFADAFAAWGN
jgi:hypothetical protein